MSYATISSKGRITVPMSVREAVGLCIGDRIHFTVLHDKTIIVRAKTVSIRDIASKAPSRRRVTVAQMNR